MTDDKTSAACIHSHSVADLNASYVTGRNDGFDAGLMKAVRTCAHLAQLAKEQARDLPNATDRLRADDRRNAFEIAATEIRALVGRDHG